MLYLVLKFSRFKASGLFSIVCISLFFAIQGCSPGSDEFKVEKALSVELSSLPLERLEYEIVDETAELIDLYMHFFCDEESLQSIVEQLGLTSDGGKDGIIFNPSDIDLNWEIPNVLDQAKLKTRFLKYEYDSLESNRARSKTILIWRNDEAFLHMSGGYPAEASETDQ